jgi:threonine/homoserine/homoserine lactone efflux protein
VLLTIAWLSFYVVLLGLAGRALRLGGVRRAIEAVTGVVLIGLGLKIVSERA